MLSRRVRPHGVQHPKVRLWNPAVQDGAADAAEAVARAQAAGHLPGAHLFLDLEGTTIATVAQTSTFDNAWAAVVVVAGYLAGCYVGSTSL